MEQTKAVQQGLAAYLHTHAPHILTQIRQTGEISQETAEALTLQVENFLTELAEQKESLQ